MSLVLHHVSPSRASSTLWLLEELGQPYELKTYRFDSGELRREPYLSINPMGKVPALEHDGVVVTESAAIALYLADAFPQAGLTVPVGDRQRGPFLRWMFFGPICLEGTMMDAAAPRAKVDMPGMLGHGQAERVADIIAAAVAKGPYLMGEQFTAADIVVGGTLRWGLQFGIVPPRDAFAPYIERLNARPASKRAYEKDQSLRAA